ncbi:MAG: translesion error-prone DNA polymerase V autoproteolytic subunit [Rubrivivax sp.]|nr:MAG: translesion error-prone DNA polymerase V autoproteolytic subunit [Rubrivivax sp.]
MAQALHVPVMAWSVPAGFASPAEDYIERRLDFNDLLVDQPDATFVVRAKGRSMEKARIYDDALLVVSRAITARHKHIVVAVVDGEFTVKRLWREDGVTRLVAESDDFPDIEFSEGQTLEVWGVVKWVLNRAPD